MTDKFEPTIIGFTCNWCSYRAADMAGTARMKYAPNVRLIRLMCSGRLDPTFVIKAFASGADGVMSPVVTRATVTMWTRTTRPCAAISCSDVCSQGWASNLDALKLLWASAAEGAMFASEINPFVEEVRKLGPLNWAHSQDTASTLIMEEVRHLLTQAQDVRASMTATRQTKIRNVLGCLLRRL